MVHSKLYCLLISSAEYYAMVWIFQTSFSTVWWDVRRFGMAASTGLAAGDYSNTIFNQGRVYSILGLVKALIFFYHVKPQMQAYLFMTNCNHKSLAGKNFQYLLLMSHSTHRWCTSKIRDEPISCNGDNSSEKNAVGSGENDVRN